MSDRLLSDWEIAKLLPQADEKCGLCNCGVCDKIAKAQDAKTAAAVNAEWVEWGDSKCPHQHLISDEHGCEVEDMLCKDCPLCWQERKRSVGL